MLFAGLLKTWPIQFHLLLARSIVMSSWLLFSLMRLRALCPAASHFIQHIYSHYFLVLVFATCINDGLSATEGDPATSIPPCVVPSRVPSALICLARAFLQPILSACLGLVQVLAWKLLGSFHIQASCMPRHLPVAQAWVVVAISKKFL